MLSLAETVLLTIVVLLFFSTLQQLIEQRHKENLAEITGENPDKYDATEDQ